jgi:hypothetical protein
MAETFFAVIVLAALGVIGYVMWLMWKELRPKNIGIMQAQPSTGEILEHIESLESICAEIRKVLTEASRMKAQKVEPKPNSANISPVGRYVPIAKRRSVEEAKSLAPATHDAKVRENNARAIESAG